MDAALVFATTYRVMRADRVLAEAGVPRGLAPTPAGIHGSCGLSLRVRSGDVAAALRLVGDAGVSADGAYRSAGGSWERVAG